MLRYCETAVDNPAPAIPIWHWKINTGSKSIFKIPPAQSPAIAYAASPSYRKMLFKAHPTVNAGADIKINIPYIFASESMVSVLPSIRISASGNNRPNTPISKPAAKDKNTLVDVNTFARSIFFAPSRRLILLPAPWPNINPNACNTAINAKTIPVAPLAETLILLT